MSKQSSQQKDSDKPYFPYQRSNRKKKKDRTPKKDYFNTSIWITE